MGAVQNFRTNPYFEDTKLTKEFRFSDDGSTSVSGTQPKWKDGMVRVRGCERASCVVVERMM